MSQKAGVEEKFKIQYHGHIIENILVMSYLFFTFDIRGCGGPLCRPGHCAASVVFCIIAEAGNQCFWCLSTLRAHTKAPYKTDLNIRCSRRPRRWPTRWPTPAWRSRRWLPRPSQKRSGSALRPRRVGGWRTDSRGFDGFDGFDGFRSFARREGMRLGDRSKLRWLVTTFTQSTNMRNYVLGTPRRFALFSLSLYVYWYTESIAEYSPHTPLSLTICS
jgi:hypothetical protein